MPSFSSNKFMKFILTGNLKPNILRQQLKFNDRYFNMMYAVRSVVSYIDTNGVFTMIFLYKIYVSIDKILELKNGGNFLL